LAANGSWIEANGVGGVVSFPGKLERAIFANLPGFIETGVDVEEAIAPEVVALAGFTRIRQAYGRSGADTVVDATGRIASATRIVEELRVTIRDRSAASA
jgi:hypothetical protein